MALFYGHSTFVVIDGGGSVCVCVCLLFFFYVLNWHQKAVTRLKDAGRIQTHTEHILPTGAHRRDWDELQRRPSSGDGVGLNT